MTAPVGAWEVEGAALTLGPPLGFILTEAGIEGTAEGGIEGIPLGALLVVGALETVGAELTDGAADGLLDVDGAAEGDFVM